MAPVVGICTICRSNIKVTEVSALTCGHTFHYNCIIHWIQQSNSCPNCRRFTRRRDLISHIFFLPPSDGDDSSSIDSDENTPINMGLVPSPSTVQTVDQPSFLPSGGANPVRRWDGRTRHSSLVNSHIQQDFNTMGIERLVEEEPEGDGWSATVDEVNDVEMTPPQLAFISNAEFDEGVNWETQDGGPISVDSISDDEVVVLSERSTIEESDSASVTSSELSSESSRSHYSSASSSSSLSSSSTSDTSSDWSILSSDSLNDDASHSASLRWSIDAMISTQETTPTTISSDETPNVIPPMAFMLTALKRAFESNDSDRACPSKRGKF